jgi:hypothetical protein
MWRDELDCITLELCQHASGTPYAEQLILVAHSIVEIVLNPPDRWRIQLMSMFIFGDIENIRALRRAVLEQPVTPLPTSFDPMLDSWEMYVASPVIEDAGNVPETCVATEIFNPSELSRSKSIHSAYPINRSTVASELRSWDISIRELYQGRLADKTKQSPIP